ncbi:MAG: hypothetical protein WD226_03815 [Planctomycetota bacterium]
MSFFAPRFALATSACWLVLACGSPTPEAPRTQIDFGRDIAAMDAAILKGATELELLALDPAGPTPETLVDPTYFHGYGIRGRATVTGSTASELLDAIGRACRENDGQVALCFNPRHAIRATAGEDTVDLVICFECLSFRLFTNDDDAYGNDLAATQEPEVSAIYRAAGLSIAPR